MRAGLFKRWWLCAVGGALCLLAAFFAFEAKLAWFSPAGSPFGQISATKLQPADAPKHIAKALAASSALQHLSTEAPVLHAVALLAILLPLSFWRPVHETFKFQAFSDFTPPQFRRPPPQS